MQSVNAEIEIRRSFPGNSGLALGICILVALALLTNDLTKHVHKALEYPIWATLFGLCTNLLMTMTHAKELIKPVFRTELFLKIGLVLLGTGVNVAEIMSIGYRGAIQAVIMVTSVFFFSWWLTGLFRLPHSMRAVMATAVSVCGVSAAIAAAGSVLAKKEELAYVTTLVILTALPLMILMPYVALALQLPADVAGGWFGGNIDTTAAVVGAGRIHSERAMTVASIVKMAQNALIGVVAFALAAYWAARFDNKGDKRSNARIIWDRFPKFILGFLLASILTSLGLFSKSNLAALQAARNWAFTLAFIGIGFEISVSSLKQIGAGPVLAYLLATCFNTILALGVSWVLFGLL